jgi:hypothetical protein
MAGRYNMVCDQGSTFSGRITYGPTPGRVNLLIDAATTAALPPGRHSYDLEFTAVAGGTVEKILAGRFIVRGEVTRNGN